MLAFDELYRRYSRRLYKFAFSILKSSDESENIIQDIFLNLWEHRNDIRKNSSVKYYIFTAAYNSAISLIRRKIRDTRYIEYLKTFREVKHEPVSIELEYRELDVKLEKIIANLPERQKQVYLLHNVEGLKYKEIANRLKISENTVENHISRALKTIRKKLGNYSLFAFLYYSLFV